MEAIDYCSQCGTYHKIYGPCDSNQIEPDMDSLEDYQPNEHFTEKRHNDYSAATWNDIRFG